MSLQVNNNQPLLEIVPVQREEGLRQDRLNGIQKNSEQYRFEDNSTGNTEPMTSWEKGMFIDFYI